MFNASLISDAKLAQIYQGLLEEDRLDRFYTGEICEVVTAAQMPAHAGEIKDLAVPSFFARGDKTGLTSLTANSVELDVDTVDRPYSTKKAGHHFSYPLALDKDKIHKQIEKAYIPGIDRTIKQTFDQELATILKGDGTATGNAQNVTVRNLSAGSNQQWNQSAADPLGDLEQAAEDSFANFIFLGPDKARVLRNRDDLKSQTGLPKITDKELAEYLRDLCKVEKVYIGNACYQNGAVTASLNLAYTFNGVAYVGRSDNLMFLQWTAPEFSTELVKKSTSVEIYGWSFGAVTVKHPELGIAFKDVA